MIKHLIWDFDGTLFDTYPGIVHAFKKALKQKGIEEEDKNILEYMKVSVSCAINRFKDLYKLDQDFIDKFVSYEKSMEPEFVQPFPYAADICREFTERGGKNYILTHRGDSTFEFLQYHGMEKYFTEVVTKTNGFKRKPDPEGFLYLVNKYNML